MPTRRGWFLLGAAVGCGVVGRVLGIVDLYVLLAAAVVLVVIAVAYVRTHRPTLVATRRLHPPRVHAGANSRVELTVRNAGGRRSAVVAVRDPFDGGARWARFLLAPLAPGETARAAYRLPTEQRGVFDLGPLEVRVSDPFGVASSRSELASVTQLTVYPRVEPIEPLPLSRGDDPDSSSDHPHSLGGAGEEFYALRPYVEGDDVRRIHWATSARLGEPMIRQNEVPWQGRATILVDTRAGANTRASFESALSAASSILSACWRRRAYLRVLTTSGFDSGFGSGQGHIEGILEHFAAAGPTRTGDLVRSIAFARQRAGGGALALITTALAPAAELEALARVGSSFGSVVLVLFERSSFDPGAATTPGRVAPTVGTVVRVTRTTPFAVAWDATFVRQGTRA